MTSTDGRRWKTSVWRENVAEFVALDPRGVDLPRSRRWPLSAPVVGADGTIYVVDPSHTVNALRDTTRQ